MSGWKAIHLIDGSCVEAYKPSKAEVESMAAEAYKRLYELPHDQPLTRRQLKEALDNTCQVAR